VDSGFPESIEYDEDNIQVDDWLAQLPVQWEAQEEEEDMRIVGGVSPLRPPSSSYSGSSPPTPPSLVFSPAYSPIEPQIEVIILPDSEEDWPDEENADEEESREEECEEELAEEEAEVICTAEVVEISDDDDRSSRPPSVIVISDDDDDF